MIKMYLTNAFENLNLLAIIVAAASAFALGALWYSPLMFVEKWMKESGVTKVSAVLQ